MTSARVVVLTVAALVIGVSFWLWPSSPALPPVPGADDAGGTAPSSAPLAWPPAPPDSSDAGVPGAAVQGQDVDASAARSPGVARPSTPISDLLRDFEREPRDAEAAATEQRIREIFAKQEDGNGVLRDVRCHETVCQIQARWSPATTGPYNAALIEVIDELSREISFEPDGEIDGVVVPMRILVRRFERAPEPAPSP